ncbi:MAG: PKD domain-containing protein [Bacteroidota bacterium]
MSSFFSILFAYLTLLGGEVHSSPEIMMCDATFSWSQSGATPCTTDPVDFTSLGDPNTIVSYNWNFAGFGNSTQPNPSFSFPFSAVPITHTVFLTVVDTAGLSCSSSQQISLNGGPAIIVTADSLGKCIQNSPDTLFSPTFTIDTTQTSLSLGPFTWDFGDGTILTSSNPVQTHVYDCYGTFLLTVRANGSNCPGYEQEVLFYTDPVSDLVLCGQPVFCEKDTICAINKTDPQCNNVDYYIWDWGIYGTSYTVSQEDTQSYVFDLTNVNKCIAPIAGYVDAVRLTAVNGCFTHFSTTQITIRPAPEAHFTAPDTVCLPDGLATFVNSTCPTSTFISDPSAYLWDFGDGSVPVSTVSPIHDYTLAGPGIYTVSLDASNNCGADTFERDIVVVQEPVAAMLPDTNQGCAPFCMNFQNLSTPDSNQLPMYFEWHVFSDSAWSFGSGSGPNSFEPEICFQAPDTFLVQLIAWNRCDSDTTDTLIYVNISPRIVLDTVADTCDVFMLDSLNYTLDDFGSPISSYTWTTTGTPAIVNGPVLTPISFQPGSHSITLTVINECGPTARSISFDVDPLPVVNAGPDQTICINDSLDLDGNPDPGFWTGAGVVNDSLFVPDTLGTYELIYTHIAPRCLAYDTLYITVIDTPMVQAMADTALCEDSSVVISLNASPIGGNWTGPNLVNGNEFVADTSGTFVFTYTLIDTVGCPGRDEVVITIHPNPEVDIMGDTALYCLVSIPQALPVASPPAGQWAGPGVSGNQFLPSILGGPDTVTLSYTFTTAFGCVDSDTVVVVVVVADSISAGPGDTLCFNHGLDTIQGAVPGNGLWSGGAYILDPMIGSFNTELMSPGLNQLIYTFAPGTSCETQDTTHILILDTLAVDVGPDEILCESSPAFLLASFSPIGGIWTGPGITNGTSGAFDPGLVPAGTSVSLTYEVIHPNGCISRDQKSILVDVLPLPAFSVDPSACTGDAVLFSNQSIGGNSYLWDFGDVNNSNAISPTHVYADTGLFTYTLIVTNGSGCQDSLSGNILILETPVPDFDLLPDSGCAPLTVTFVDQSIPSRGTYFWDFGNGDTSSSPTPPPVSYLEGTDDTTYYVSLCITNACSTVCKTDSVHVFPRPQVRFGPAVNSGCSVFPVDFGNATLGNPDNFFWYLDSISSASLFSTDSIPPTIFLSHTPDTGFTVYTVYLIATNSCGADTGSVDITVFPNTIDAFFNTSPISGCEPLTVQFQGLSGAPFFGWEIEGTQPTVIDPVHTFSQAGSYTVYHYVNNGCSFDTNSIQIIVQPSPQVSFAPDMDVVCIGTPILFSNTSIGTTGYTWDFGDNIGTNLENPTHTYFSAGVYVVSLTALSDTNNCPNMVTDTITVLPLPDPGFTLSDTAACPPLLVATDSTTNGLNYFWDFGDSTASILQHPVHQYDSTGVYTISLQVTDNQGCQNSATASIQIFEVPQPDFAILEDTVCGENALVEFQNQSSATTPLASLWTFGDGDSSQLHDPTHVYGMSGNFDVQLTVSNPFGCVDSIHYPVWVLPQPQAQIGADSLQGCAPLLVNLQDLSSGNSHAHWSLDGTGISGGALSYVFSVPDTIYQIILEVDTADFCFDSDTITIETSSEPVSAFTVDEDQHCDAPATVQFSDVSQSSRPITYIWDFGDGDSSTLANPVHTYTSVGVFVVSLIVSNDFGCQAVSSDTIYVHPQPLAQATADTTAGCVPLDVVFVDSSTNNSQLVWNINNQSFSSNSVSYTFAIPDTSYEVILSVDTAGFCFDADTILIQTSSWPEAGFFVDADRHCDAPAMVQFTDTSSSTRPLSYAWAFGDGTTSNLEHPGHTYFQIGEWIVSQIISNDFGCADTSGDTIFVYPQPQAIIGADTIEGCVPLSVQFTNLSTGASDWEWIIDGGPIGTQNPAYTYTVADTDVVVLMVDTADFCFDTTSIDIQIANPPQSAFSVSESQFCEGPATVQFTDQSQSEVPVSYLWTFGDGNSSTAQHPSHGYLQVGQYVVTQMISSAYGCVDSSKDTIFVYPIPQAMFVADSLQGCVPFDVNLQDQSTHATGWQWVVAGDTLFDQDLAITFVQPDTTYVVELIVDTAGFCFDTTSIQIEVASPPLSNFAKDWDQICDIPALNTFTDLSQSSRPLLYRWTFGDGESSVLANPNHIYQSTGTFAVGLEVINDFNCRDTLTDTVHVYPQPVADILATPERGCAPLLVQFANQSQQYSNSLWDFGDNSGNSRETDPSHLYTLIDQSFIVELIVDTAGFCFDTSRVQIDVASEPIAAFTPSLTEACGSASVDFVNESFSAALPLSYLWDFGNGETSSLEHPSVIFGSPGEYDVRLIVLNTYGCADTVVHTIRIIPQAQAMFSAEPTDGCQPLSVEFTDLSTNATEWRWEQGDGSHSLDSVFTHVYQAVGTYDVRLIVSYEGKCADEITFQNFISVAETPVAGFFANDSMIMDRFDGTVIFTNTSFNADRYEWDFDDGSAVNTSTNPIHRFSGNQAYDVRLIAYLGACADTVVQTVQPNGFGGLYIPNAFAPLHGPGEYSLFFPKGTGLTEYHIGVYTIWGDLVWESTVLDDHGQPAEWWDGRINGQLANSDVFVWRVHTAVFEGNVDWPGPTVGSLTLIR